MTVTSNIYWTMWWWQCSFQSDDNKDGKLTLQEMLNHEDIFYNTVYENSDDDYDDDDGHDEF